MLEENMDDLKKMARQMIIDGKTNEEIRKKTNLREKDVKKIQKEIISKF
ncbi:hypothetical protein [Clostridium rectalis]|nr:hypothetical protein [Clostridium rectalis]